MKPKSNSAQKQTPALEPLAKGGPAPAPAESSPGSFVGLLLIFGGLGLLVFAWKWQAQPKGRYDQASLHQNNVGDLDQVVNRNLLLTNKQIELQQEKARLGNLRAIPSVGQEVLPRLRAYQMQPVDAIPDRNEGNAARDLENPKELNLTSPDTEIQQELADSETEAKNDYAARKAYAQQFIENARAGGYEVQLDDNFVVKSVRPLKSGSLSR